MPRSRYRRLEAIRERLVLTPRDVQVLEQVHNHRYAYALHLHGLCFEGRALRVAQARLAKLWQHGYLDRHFIPFTLDGARRPPPDAATPIYALGERGVEFLTRLHEPAELAASPYRLREASPSTLAHRLVVTDLLSSIDIAAARRNQSGRITTQQEWRLWKEAADRKVPTTGLVVPDGAVTFRDPDRPGADTWYVEIVRAGVSGGNDSLLAKMRRYLALRAEGRFRTAFGHDRVRGVFIAAPTPERARNLRALASRLEVGRRFFAFTHFEDCVGDLRSTRFTPEEVLDLGWVDGAGGVVRLGHTSEREAPAPAA